MKIMRSIAAIAALALMTLAASVALAADHGPPLGSPGVTENCLDTCSLPSVDPFDAPACDVLGVVSMTACIPDLSIDVMNYAANAGDSGALSPGRTYGLGVLVRPVLKIPAHGVTGPVRIDPGRITYV